MDFSEILHDTSLRKLVGGILGVGLAVLYLLVKWLFQSLFGAKRKSLRDKEEQGR